MPPAPVRARRTGLGEGHGQGHRRRDQGGHDDLSTAEINTRLILFSRDLRQSARSQTRITGVDEPQSVPAPAPVSFCVDPTDELAVTVQGWDDDDDGDGSDGVPGHFDADGNDDDDALAGVTKSLGQAANAAGTSSGASDDMSASFQIEVSNEDTDADGLADCEETETHKTNPQDADTDDDGLNDGDEVARGTDPLDPDSDNDGLDDGTEVTQAPIRSTPTAMTTASTTAPK